MVPRSGAGVVVGDAVELLSFCGEERVEHTISTPREAMVWHLDDAAQVAVDATRRGVEGLGYTW